MYVSVNYGNIVSDNDLSPVWHQAIICGIFVYLKHCGICEIGQCISVVDMHKMGVLH